MTIKVRLADNYGSARTEVWVYRERRDGVLELAEPMVFTPIPVRHGAQGEPTLSCEWGDLQLLQAFLDAAWRRGLRPADFEDGQGQLAATRAHLADMRALIEKATEVKLP